jgi:uncharacterized membrane protein YphA (DoxX/SURF4 family)
MRLTMNALMWFMEGMIAAFFLGSGLTKLIDSRDTLDLKGMGYMEDLTDRQVKGIGALEVLAAIGLTVPAALRVLPVLTSVAALGLVLLMLLSIRVRLRRRERHEVPVNVVLACTALLVALLRF